MPTTTFRRELQVSADPRASWAVLTDVSSLVDWVGILDELVELSPLEQYTAVLMDRLGPFKLKADLAIDVTDVVTDERIRVRAAGEDRQVASRIEIDVLLTLAPGPDRGSTVVVDGSYQVTGKVATMGAGMIRQKATKILDQFVTRAAERLGNRT